MQAGCHALHSCCSCQLWCRSTAQPPLVEAQLSSNDRCFVPHLLQGPVGWSPPRACPLLRGPRDFGNALLWAILAVSTLGLPSHIVPISPAQVAHSHATWRPHVYIF